MASNYAGTGVDRSQFLGILEDIFGKSGLDMSKIISIFDGEPLGTGELGKIGSPVVPSVPIDRLVTGPTRPRGRGKRDTMLNGADGLQ